MVGVPTSKGCILCLKRSVKCDEGRPSCAQCTRGRRVCPGYGREMKFVDEGPKLRRAGRSVENHRGEMNRRPGAARECVRQSWLGLREVSSSKVDLVQILSSFVSALFPLGTTSTRSSFLGSWLWHVPLRLGRSEVLDPAALSLAFAYFARLSGDRAILRKAELSYFAALSSLAKSIADPCQSFGSDVLCAVLLLGHYETFGSKGHAWIRHAGGAARLMELRGAKRCYDSAFEYSMFLACRGGVISEALASRKPCFLDADDWRAIPDGLIEFPLLPERPELCHAIFACFAAVPGLLSRASQMVGYIPETERLSILSAAYALRRDMIMWYHSYISADGGVREPVRGTPHLESPDYPFQFEYVYKDVVSATMITTNYAYLLLLSTDCLNRLEPEPDSNREAVDVEMARAICMSVKFCLGSGYCGEQTIKFALPVAHGILPSEQREWCERWIDRAQEGEETNIT